MDGSLDLHLGSGLDDMVVSPERHAPPEHLTRKLHILRTYFTIILNKLVDAMNAAATKKKMHKADKELKKRTKKENEEKTQKQEAKREKRAEKKAKKERKKARKQAKKETKKQAKKQAKREARALEDIWDIPVTGGSCFNASIIRL